MAIWEKKILKTGTNVFRRRIAESCRRYELWGIFFFLWRYKVTELFVTALSLIILTFVCIGETAASGEGARKGHARDGAGDAAEREGGRAFQDLG